MRWDSPPAPAPAATVVAPAAASSEVTDDDETGEHGRALAPEHVRFEIASAPGR